MVSLLSLLLCCDMPAHFLCQWRACFEFDLWSCLVAGVAHLLLVLPAILAIKGCAASAVLYGPEARAVLD